MSTDVIGSRYRVGSVVTCTPESTTWHARDTWLDEQVLSPGRGRAFLETVRLRTCPTWNT